MVNDAWNGTRRGVVRNPFGLPRSAATPRGGAAIGGSWDDDPCGVQYFPPRELSRRPPGKQPAAAAPAAAPAAVPLANSALPDLDAMPQCPKCGVRFAPEDWEREGRCQGCGYRSLMELRALEVRDPVARHEYGTWARVATRAVTTIGRRIRQMAHRRTIRSRRPLACSQTRRCRSTRRRRMMRTRKKSGLPGSRQP